MTKVEELVEKEEKELDRGRDYIPKAVMLRGIGYAILALAEAIHEKKVAKDDE